MKQVLCVRTDGDIAESVEIVEVDEPTYDDEQVVVEVRVRPINPADVLLLRGRHFVRPQLPTFVGIEGAGVVVRAGSRAGIEVGTKVALPYGGTWKERVAIRGDVVLPLPADFDLEQASMLSVNPFTAAGLLEGLAPGSVVVTNAANSALGKMIIRLAVRRGLSPIAVVRRADAIAEVEGIGAKAVIVDSDNLATDVQRAADGAPIARALDAVAGDATKRLFQCLANGSELIVYGLLSSNEVVLPAAPLIFSDIVVKGFSRLRILSAMPPERRRAITLELLDLLRDGTLASDIEARYPLDEVRAALTYHESPARRGKILLVS
jgi:mitochondrial enoyl-[acyl-carrier protein] reductase / trans-2-enoyl-CoA reductase